MVEPEHDRPEELERLGLELQPFCLKQFIEGAGLAQRLGAGVAGLRYDASAVLLRSILDDEATVLAALSAGASHYVSFRSSRWNAAFEPISVDWHPVARGVDLPDRHLDPICVGSIGAQPRE